MTFTWNSANERSHYCKHKIRFCEAISIFDDLCATTTIDNRHGETQFTIIGGSSENRLLRITYTEESVDEIRIITADKASLANRAAYLNGIK